MYDFLIIGGGPAGATVGKYLSKYGYKVAIFQKDLNYNKPCGGGIRADAFGLERVNL